MRAPRIGAFLAVWLGAPLALVACDRRSSSPVDAVPIAESATSAATAPPVAPAVALDVVFSSEKKDWAGEAIGQFNASGAKTDDGRPIQVKVTFMGSVEPIDAIAARGVSFLSIFPTMRKPP